MPRRYFVETIYGTEASFEFEFEAIEFIVKYRLVGIARIRVSY
jgi:hypothetical protein